MFACSEVIVLTNKHTNKQTPLKTSDALRYATTLGNYEYVPGTNCAVYCTELVAIQRLSYVYKLLSVSDRYGEASRRFV